MTDDSDSRPVSGPTFADLFGRAPEVAADAPGRVNLIGEHTDYNDGFVLPIAIAQRTHVELARRTDPVVRAWSEAFGHEEPASYRLGEEARTGGWVDYVQGVTRALAGFGARIGGFDLRVRSSVPVGAGVSSSAAFEISLARGLRQLFDLALDDVALARAGQRAENDLVGAPVGIMDQMAALFADEHTALFLDTRSLAFERVTLPDALDIAVVHSGIRHEHATGGYRQRRQECEEAARLLGVPKLRDAEGDGVPDLSGLPAAVAARARHVITEDRRVVDTVDALKRADLAAIGRLLRESHASMRDDFEMSLPEIDLMVELAGSLPDVLGARITGGGFGGSIVIATRGGEAGRVARELVARLQGERGLRPFVVQG